MQACKVFARIEPSGTLTLDELPFAPGTLVEVLVCDAELSKAERARIETGTVEVKAEAPKVNTAGVSRTTVREDDIEARLEAMRGAKPA